MAKQHRMCESILKRGAEIEARNKDNQTLLHLAASENSTECTKLLMERGAEIEARNKDN